MKAPHSQNSAYAGYDIAFSSGYLKALYPTHQDYVAKVRADVDQLRTQHWLTDNDAADLISRAEAANVPGS